MQALVVDQRRPGRIDFVTDRAAPEPQPGDVLIAVRYAGICTTDLEIARGYMAFSGVPGHEFVGTVVDGPAPLRSLRVVAEINCACEECDLCRRGLPTHCRRRTVVGILGRDGAFAELLAVPERNCYIVPDEIGDEQAVFIEPLAAAVQVVRQVPIGPGLRAAVVGSGRLGLLVAQVLALQGCELVVIGRNERTLALCAGWGLRMSALKDITAAGDYDIVVDCTGSPDGLRLALRLCRPRGTIVLKSTYAAPEPIDLAPLVVNEVQVVGSRCGPFPDAIELLRQGRIDVAPLVSAVYPLSRGVEAFAAAGDPRNIKILLRPGSD